MGNRWIVYGNFNSKLTRTLGIPKQLKKIKRYTVQSTKQTRSVSKQKACLLANGPEKDAQLHWFLDFKSNTWKIPGNWELLWLIIRPRTINTYSLVTVHFTKHENLVLQISRLTSIVIEAAKITTPPTLKEAPQCSYPKQMIISVQERRRVRKLRQTTRSYTQALIQWML